MAQGVGETPCELLVINTIVLAAVVIYEMVGPICVRLAIVRSGEARPSSAERDALWATDHNPS